MSLYSFFLFLHVVSAVLGVGPAGALIMVSFQRPLVPTLARGLARLISGTLLIMVVTGVMLVKLTGWTLGHSGWVRTAFALTLVVGFLAGRIARSLRKPEDPSVIVSVQRMSVLIAAVVVIIVYLMVLKPF